LFLIVTLPYANLRQKPSEPLTPIDHDDLRETQLLYNEILERKGENGDWYFVEALEQRKYAGSRGWQSYPGWVRKDAVEAMDSLPEYNCVVQRPTAQVRRKPDDAGEVAITLSLGTRLFATGEAIKGSYSVAMSDGSEGWIDSNSVRMRAARPADERLRKDLVHTSLLLAGIPYLWGGRSTAAGFSGAAFGIDCSGLTNLVFRVNEIDIPRDAYDQWLSARNIDAGELLAGDLIFLSKEGEEQVITHVMLSLGGEEFIEAPETGSMVRVATFQEKFGLDLGQIAGAGSRSGPMRFHFGNILGLS
jgi:gamma-D-glutamyl-L-lysine dipeptidyl-peptidase